MAFSYEILKTGHAGGMKIVTGKYANSSSSGGVIKTGLSTVMGYSLTNKGTTANQYPACVNGSLPINAVDGAVTIVTVSNIDGSFVFYGE